MQKIFAFTLVSGLAITANAAVITQWNFEAQTTAASTGSGTASLIGGTTATFAAGFSGAGTFAWNTTNYPAASTGSKTAGVEFDVSTLLYQDIKVTWNERHSNTSANTTVLQYTTNGTTWLDAQNYTFTPAATGTGDTWYSRSFDFTGIVAVNNNAAFAVRIVSAFAPSTTNYLASRSTSTYASTGTLRFDDVTFEGTAIPGSGTLALAGAGLVLAGRRRRA